MQALMNESTEAMTDFPIDYSICVAAPGKTYLRNDSKMQQ